MSFRKNRKDSVIFDLADKYHVSLTRFNRESYFHIRQNYGGKFVSLNMADMTSLVQNFDAMKKKLKQMKKSESSNNTNSSSSSSGNNKPWKKRKFDDDGGDESTTDESGDNEKDGGI